MTKNQKIIAGVGCGCLALVVGVVSIAGFAITGLFGLIKGSEPYEEAVRRATSNPLAIAALGTPIEPGFWAGGSINLQNDDGTADITFPVSGPNGSGTISVNGTKTDGTWSFSKMELKTNSGESIDLGSVPH